MDKKAMKKHIQRVELRFDVEEVIEALTEYALRHHATEVGDNTTLVVASLGEVGTVEYTEAEYLADLRLRYDEEVQAVSPYPGDDHA